MEIDLKGKRALVTGGNSGIGEAIALAFASAGADTAVNYIAHPETAREVVGKIESRNVRALGLEADVSDAGQVGAMFARIDDAWGGLDVLVNNAGIDGGRALAWEADPKIWEKVVAINLLGAFHCAREALRRMVAARGGVVLTITSVHERIPWSGYSAYTASKAGAALMTQTLAQEAAPHGVRVLALAPGAVKTPINRNVWDEPKTLKDLLAKIPLGRMGEAEEIAKMAVVLASDAASYMTGTSVFVDGGMSLYPSFEEGG
jgi:glucose 1-dehydrogenase